ncbi:MAG: hypothetical protein RL885_09280 [Planctomycetota bacterium]
MMTGILWTAVLMIVSAGGDTIEFQAQTVLKGSWEGSASVSDGGEEAVPVPWSLTFGRGDLSEVTGRLVAPVKSAKGKGLHLSKPFQMSIVCEIEGGNTFETRIEARFDPTGTRLTGSFSNVAGRGTFELTKQGTAPPSTLAGAWNGELTGKKGRWLRRGNTAALSLNCPKEKSWDGVQAKVEGLEVQEVVTSLWDEQSRSAIVSLRCAWPGKSKEAWLRALGTFDEKGTSFEGTFESETFGSGDLRLSRQ